MSSTFETRLNHFLQLLWEGPIKGRPVFDPWNEVACDDVKDLGNDFMYFHPRVEIPKASDRAQWWRRSRLHDFLSRQDAEWILVGEAPGYQGCRISGIPFTSEALILDGAIPRVSTRTTRLSIRERPWKEPSATIIWKHLYGLGIAEKTILWNAFPWHPHFANEPLSNRRPTAEDGMDRAGEILTRLIACYPRATVVAVGRVAEGLLASLQVPAAAVRHPANGGASKFRRMLEAVVEEAS